jgi:hypothetical protein
VIEPLIGPNFYNDFVHKAEAWAPEPITYVDKLPPLHEQVKKQHRKWRARQDANRTLPEDAAAVPDLVFVQMILCGLLRRRRCGEVLLDRFGFDVLKRSFLPGRENLSAEDGPQFAWTYGQYAFYEHLFWTGLHVVYIAHKQGKDLRRDACAVITVAARAMARAWQRRPLYDGIGLQAHDDTLGHVAALSVAGWARTTLTNTQTKRLGRILRKERKTRDMERITEEDILLESLAINTPLVYHQGFDWTLAELSKRIRYEVECDVQHRAHIMKKDVEQLLKKGTNFPASLTDDALQQFETMELYAACLAQANLSDYEKEIVRLQALGYTDKEKAQYLKSSGDKRAIDAIKKGLQNGRKKLDQARKLEQAINA